MQGGANATGSSTDERIEAFLQDVLRNEGANSNEIREDTRFHLAEYERMFREAELDEPEKTRASTPSSGGGSTGALATSALRGVAEQPRGRSLQLMAGHHGVVSGGARFHLRGPHDRSRPNRGHHCGQHACIHRDRRAGERRS
jgi:hypothetical protein